MAAKTLPDAAYVRECLYYNPETGLFSWRKRPLSHFLNAARQKAINTLRAGKLAGTAEHGYVKICIDGHKFYAHRLAWLLAHGAPVPEYVDHKDGNRTNNQISNLRAASHAQNLANAQRHHDNSTGVKGVWLLPNGRYEAYVHHNYRKHHVGYFATLEEATVARREAAELLHGEFARD